MPKVLIQFAHPVYSRSRVHKTLVRYARGIKGVTFNDLYEQYPDLFIDIKREQRLLREHDIIILQHPFFWYSSPPIIKQWLDLVLEYDWAYGPEGKALVGKKLVSAISCGSSEHAYTEEGHHVYPVEQFLIPYKQTAALCNMEYMTPFIVYGTHRMERAILEEEGQRYRDMLIELAEGQNI